MHCVRDRNSCYDSNKNPKFPDCATVTTSCAIVESLLDYLYLHLNQNTRPPPFHEPEDEVIQRVLYREQPDLMCQVGFPNFYVKCNIL